MAIVKPNDINVKIAKALGIEADNIQSITIRMLANEVVSVDMLYYPDKKDLKKLIPVLKKYQLIEKTKNQGKESGACFGTPIVEE